MSQAPKRKTIRLPDYDYSQAGYYFVTVCTHNAMAFFGRVSRGEFVASRAGRIVQQVWRSLPDACAGVAIDAFALMPNHLHGIIVLLGDDSGAMNRAPTLGDVIRRFKATSTLQIRRTTAKLFKWQRNYYEHIIRDDASLCAIRRYVEFNALLWALDRYNPAAVALRSGKSAGKARRAGISHQEVLASRSLQII